MSTLTQKSNELAVSWPKAGEYGIVPIDSLVPNPKNPRKYFDPDDTSSLAKSIVKGGKREVTTVRELTVEEKAKYRKEYPKGRYMITSGGRRYLAALQAGVTTADIRVKEYKRPADESLDMYMLNEDRVGLSDLENMWAVDALRKEHGWTTIEETAENINRDTNWVSTTLALLKCIPEVQAKMHPSVKYHSRMRRPVGVFFSKLAADVQLDLVCRMPSSLTSAAAQLDWLNKQINEKGIELRTRTRDPNTIRSVLGKLAENILHRATYFNTAPESDRLFENTDDVQAQAFTSQIRRAIAELQKMLAKVEALAASEKKQTMIVPREAMPWAKPQRPLDPTLGPTSLKVSPHIVPLKRPVTTATVVEKVVAPPVKLAPPAPRQQQPMAGHARVALRPFSQTPTVLPASIPRSGRTVNAVYEFEPGKFKRETLTLRRYMELWDAKKLEFQVKGEERPSNYPDRKLLHG